MPTTATELAELAEARDILAQLLELLDLAGHRFELSLEGDGWDVDLECPAPDGWLSVRLRIPRQALRAAAMDNLARQRLVDTLDARLRGCQRRSSTPPK